MPFQLESARRVIEEMNGRAILADEVGLGKTIEAGLIFKEYLARGEIDKSLILVPASLGFQWTNELVEKFNIEDIFFNRKGRIWDYFDHQIASLDKAKRDPHARELRKIEYDLVIVDEAHRLKNHKTLNWKFVNSLNKKYCLLLTATPIQNKLKELYNLVSILFPERFQSYGEFKNKYKIKNNNIEKNNSLQQDLSEIMIRNHHQDTILDLSQRNIHRVMVKLNSREERLYNKVEKYVAGCIVSEKSSIFKK